MTAPTQPWSPDEIAAELPAAIESGRLHLYYQPIVSLADRSTTRLEGLPRWDHPEHGLTAPESFIDAASEAGLLRRLEVWAIEEAMHQLAQWRDGVPGSLSVTLNISLEHAVEPGLADLVSGMADAAGVATGRLGFELPYARLGVKIDSAIPALQRLADIGVDLTVDGYSNPGDVTTLTRSPVSTVKIGRDIVAGTPDDPDRVALINAIIARGQECGLGIVATGVESPGQAAYLREAGCHFGQGFLFSVAMPAEVLEQRMQDR